MSPILNIAALSVAYYFMKDSWNEIAFMRDSMLTNAAPYLLWFAVMVGTLIFVYWFSKFIQSFREEKEWKRYIKSNRLDISNIKLKDIQEVILNPRLRIANMSLDEYRKL